MKNCFGIWLDGKGAQVVNYTDGQCESKKVKSEIHHHNVKGGSRTSTPYARQGSVSERRSLERKEHELHDYFEHLFEEIADASYVHVFGPGEVKKRFAKFLLTEKRMDEDVLSIDTADSITEAQITAKVREHFDALFEQK